jgi:hypothetical protein
MARLKPVIIGHDPEEILAAPQTTMHRHFGEKIKTKKKTKFDDFIVARAIFHTRRSGGALSLSHHGMTSLQPATT